jgi:hypothetical protein
MFVHMILMPVMKMAIVKIIDMAVMENKWSLAAPRERAVAPIILVNHGMGCGSSGFKGAYKPA